MEYDTLTHFFNTLEKIIPYVLVIALIDLSFILIKKILPNRVIGLRRKIILFFKRLLIWLVVIVFIWGIGALGTELLGVAAKPVIYLYPETTTDITVKLDFKGELIADYPEYDANIGGWQVTASPDGTLINHADGKEYSYLFWEGVPDKKTEWDVSKGFVVQGKDTREFLQNTLANMGLTPKEYNEFIVYWYPKMKDNTYNLIHFAGREYTDTAPLTITPEPDSLVRVFMVYKSIEKPISIEPQVITPFEREGFTVVEWGGSEI